jgi:hypothetical protein
VSKYDKNDAARDTNCTPKDVSRAWHDSRDTAASEGSLGERNSNKTSDSSTGSRLSSIFTGLFGSDRSGYQGGRDSDHEDYKSGGD